MANIKVRMANSLIARIIIRNSFTTLDEDTKENDGIQGR